jgi:hypothetical protein
LILSIKSIITEGSLTQNPKEAQIVITEVIIIAELISKMHNNITPDQVHLRFNSHEDVIRRNAPMTN